MDVGKPHPKRQIEGGYRAEAITLESSPTWIENPIEAGKHLQNKNYGLNTPWGTILSNPTGEIGEVLYDDAVFGSPLAAGERGTWSEDNRSRGTGQRVPTLVNEPTAEELRVAMDDPLFGDSFSVDDDELTYRAQARRFVNEQIGLEGSASPTHDNPTDSDAHNRSVHRRNFNNRYRAAGLTLPELYGGLGSAGYTESEIAESFKTRPAPEAPTRSLFSRIQVGRLKGLAKAATGKNLPEAMLGVAALAAKSTPVNAAMDIFMSPTNLGSGSVPTELTDDERLLQKLYYDDLTGKNSDLPSTRHQQMPESLQSYFRPAPGTPVNRRGSF